MRISKQYRLKNLVGCSADISVKFVVLAFYDSVNSTAKGKKRGVTARQKAMSVFVDSYGKLLVCVLRMTSRLLRTSSYDIHDGL